MEEIQNEINESRMRWFGHMKRTDEYCAFVNSVAQFGTPRLQS